MRLAVAACLALVPFAAVTGCVILPVPMPSHSGVGVITEEVTESLKPGETTRADVLLRFGAPGGRFEDDRFYAYAYERTHGYLIIAVAYIGGAAGPMKKRHYLGLEFSPDGRLKRFTFIDPGLNQDSDQLLNQWMGETAGSTVAPRS